MSESLLLKGSEPEESGVSGDEAQSENGSEFLSEPSSATLSPLPGRRSPADRGLLDKLRKLRVGGASRQDEAGEYKVYPWRWFMLATLCLLNLSNGMVCSLHYHSHCLSPAVVPSPHMHHARSTPCSAPHALSTLEPATVDVVDLCTHS